MVWGHVQQTDMIIRRRLVADDETGNLEVGENIKDCYSSHSLLLCNKPL